MSQFKLFPHLNSTSEAPAPSVTAEKRTQKLSKGALGLLLGTTLAVFAGTGWLLTRQSPIPTTDETKVTPLLVETILASKQSLTGAETVTGTVEPVETVTITSRILGQITSLPLQEGDRVKAGQVLAKIDVKDIQAQGDRATAAISQAQAGVIVARAAQNQAITQKNQAIALVNQAIAREQQAIAQRQEAQAELANARLQQRRMTTLASEGAVPQVQLDEANTKVTVIETRISQASAGIEQARRALDSARAGVEQAQAGVEQAQAGVKQAIAQVEQTRASQKEATANLDYGIVNAPFDGVITGKHTEVGAMAGPGQPLVTLEGTKQLRFSVEIPESAISRLREGDIVQVQVDSLNRLVSGRVTRIIPSANPSSRSFTIKIALPTTSALMPGMFGRLQLPRSNSQGILIPTQALIRRGQLEGIYVVDANQQATLRWIKTGKRQGEQLEVTSGLVAGERVILSNLSELTDGQPIEIREQK